MNMEFDAIRFAKDLAEWRERERVSLAGLGAQVNRAAASIQRIEYGGVRYISDFVALCNATGLKPADYFVEAV